MTLFQPMVLLVVWVAALYGTLQIHYVPGNWGHGICGSWGCGPPTQALVACHAFWFVFISGPGTWSLRSWTGGTLRSVGIALTAVGALALLAIGVHDMLTWLSTMGESIQRYSIQRYLFRVITLIDLPAVPLLVAGIVGWRVGRRRIFASESAVADELPALEPAPVADADVAAPVAEAELVEMATNRSR